MLNITQPAPRRTGFVALTLGTLLMGSTAQAQVQLDFWDQIWGPPVYAETAQRLVDEFNASQSDIKVTYRSVPWTNWYETYVTAIASGSAPDLSTGAGFQAVQFYDLDAIYPVDELIAQMTADGSISDYAPATLEAVQYDGHYVALPWAVDVRTVLYRKDMLEAAGVPAPTTWDEMRAAAKAVTGDGKYGLVSSGDLSGLHWILAATINNGGGLFDAEGKPALNTGRSMEALEFLAGFVADGSLNPASAGYKADDARGAFYRGEAAFLLDNPNSGKGAAPDQQEFIGVLPPLKGAQGDTGTIYWVNNVMVYKQTEHPAETLTFLKWWSENQLPLWTDGANRSIPARLSFQADPVFQGTPNVKLAIDEYLPVAKPMSASKGGTFPQLNEIDGDGFLMSLIQQIWQGGDVAAAAAESQAYLEDVMAD